ncbi:MAG: DUF1269 domain-containing protein [Planctomycetes bacterium]|nr:DUF1269 domain-containing protein [Planctomycetota bacterium]
MSELIVVAYPDPMQAEEVRLKLLRLQREYLVDLEDAVVVLRRDDGKVQLRQLHNLTASGAISGGFWGTLVGMLFLSPLLGLAVGAAAGAASGALADVGIDDAFLKQLGARLSPGGSALCVLVRKATPDRVIEQLRDFGGELMQTSLSHADEERLRAALQRS